ncbi:MULTISPECIES: GntR family transcriptional regulator [Streptomyces]|uniref:GntR family transcriptional regulator n=1 Tax=Streptomyces lycopersici TaxID=2974589 RepID=UPI0021CFFCC1|nr:GntR family transcriptional regulator [Streptomyces sp. NEAU-383]
MTASEPPEPPAYLRLARDLRRRIEDGRLPAGAQLPSRAQLARTYGVGPNVANSAVRVLMAEGLVHGRAGSGVYVREPRALRRMLRSWHDGRLSGTPYVLDLPGHGGGRREGSSTTLTAPPGIAERLGLASGAQVVRSAYVFWSGGGSGEGAAREGTTGERATGERAMISTSWEPLELTGGTPVALPEAGPLAGRGVVARMAHIGLPVDRAVEAVVARTASAEEASLLEIAAGSVVEALERTYYSGDRAVETADIVVPAGRYQLVYEFPVD